MLCKNYIEQLWREHYAEMFKFAVTMLHDEEEARDAVSCVFARLLDRHEKESISRGYLMMSVKGVCLNRISHLKVREKAARLLLLETTAETPGTTEIDELTENIWQFINSELTEKARDIIYRRYAGNMSCGDIAREDGVSRQAVYKHIIKALDKLHKRFGNNGRSH